MRIQKWWPKNLISLKLWCSNKRFLFLCVSVQHNNKSKASTVTCLFFPISTRTRFLAYVHTHTLNQPCRSKKEEEAYTKKCNELVKWNCETDVVLHAKDSFLVVCDAMRYVICETQANTHTKYEITAKIVITQPGIWRFLSLFFGFWKLGSQKTKKNVFEMPKKKEMIWICTAWCVYNYTYIYIAWSKTSFRFTNELFSLLSIWKFFILCIHKCWYERLACCVYV